MGIEPVNTSLDTNLDTDCVHWTSVLNFSDLTRTDVTHSSPQFHLAAVKHRASRSDV